MTRILIRMGVLLTLAVLLVADWKLFGQWREVKSRRVTSQTPVHRTPTPNIPHWEEAIRSSLLSRGPGAGARAGNRSGFVARSYGFHPRATDLFADNPPLEAAYLRAYAANLNVEYAAFFRTLEMNDDEIAQFDAILLEWKVDQSDLNAAASTMAMAPDDSAIDAMGRQQRKTRDAELQESLGPEGLSDFKAYNASYDSRIQVEQLNELLVGNSLEPLSLEQINILTSMLHASGIRYTPYIRAGQSGPDSDVYTSVAEMASKKISPAQMTAFSSWLSSLQLHQAVQNASVGE